MKRIITSIAFLLILLCSVAFAALVKTTSDSNPAPGGFGWQEQDPSTVAVGVAWDISDSYDTLLYLEVAYASGGAQDGVGVTVEVSYGDDDWTSLTEFTTPPAIGGQSDVLDGEHVDGSTTLTIVGVGNPNYRTRAQKIFIGGVAGGPPETVRMKVGVGAGSTMTLCHDTLYLHEDGAVIWNTVQEYVLPIPAAFAFVRVIINNTDADADIQWVTRISKVESL